VLTPGSEVAGYRIVRVLGSGGMGSVYLAQHPSLPRRDALKVLSAELSRDPDFRARFVREADVASALDHPNIVAVYDRGETDSQLWIAMQFVDGTDADNALRAGTMTPQRAIHVVGEVAKALDHAHERNVVHRDVKPANFLVSGEVGPDERVLLGDFGIARALDDVGLTVTGAVMATVAYAAPEVLSGQTFDRRADLYSLGCTLFRLLTGKTPFSAANGMAAVMMAHLQAPPPRVTDHVPLPRGLDWVIATAMAKNPGERFRSGADLAAAAAAALQDTAGVGVPLMPIPSADVVSYPHTPGSGPEWWQQTGGPRTVLSAPPSAPSKPRRRGLVIGGIAAAVLAVGGTVTAVTLTQSGGTAPAAGPGASHAGSTAEAPPATDVPTSALKGLLLTSSEIPGNLAGDTVVLSQDKPDLLDDSGTIDANDCLGAWAPAQGPVYANSGYSGAAVQIFRALNKQQWQAGVIQAAVSFPAPAQAQQFVSGQALQWSSCAGRKVVIAPPGTPAQTWTFGEVKNAGSTMTLDASLDGGGSCQRALAARGNVVIDVQACHADPSDQAGEMISAISAKVPRQ
jgi:eukaryotic-like serine/threonine-protein kinase